MYAAATLSDGDGACRAAKIVLAHLSGFDIEESWNDKRGEYDATVKIHRWHNCREQGYTLELEAAPYRLLDYYITFYEHRNSDDICVLEYEHRFINPPSIDTLPEKFFPDKWSVTASFEYDQHARVADWIKEKLTKRYLEYKKTLTPSAA